MVQVTDFWQLNQVSTVRSFNSPPGIPADGNGQLYRRVYGRDRLNSGTER